MPMCPLTPYSETLRYVRNALCTALQNMFALPAVGETATVPSIILTAADEFLPLHFLQLYRVLFADEETLR